MHTYRKELVVGIGVLLNRHLQKIVAKQRHFVFKKVLSTALEDNYISTNKTRQRHEITYYDLVHGTANWKLYRREELRCVLQKI